MFGKGPYMNTVRRLYIGNNRIRDVGGEQSTRENLLPKVHFGRIVVRPGHVRLIVKDEIFLLGRRHCRPLNPRAEKMSNRLRGKS